jgi:hypothetical protein
MVEQSPEQTIAADLLIGAEKICEYIQALGFNATVDTVYYAKKTGRWPITKHGNTLLASKSKLTRHARSILAA